MKVKNKISESAVRQTEGDWSGYKVCRAFEPGEGEEFQLKKLDESMAENFNDDLSTPVFPSRRGDVFQIKMASENTRIMFADSKDELPYGEEIKWSNVNPGKSHFFVFSTIPETIIIRKMQPDEKVIRGS